MIIQRIYIQNTTAILPSTFNTSVEIALLLDEYNGTKFCLIKPENFTPCVTVERKGNKLAVTATTIANAKNVFDSKITVRKAQQIPLKHLFCFNLDGKVLGIKRTDHTNLFLDETRTLAAQTGLNMVPYSHTESKTQFVGLLLATLLNKVEAAWEGVTRTGFYIGDNVLGHTNKFALPGIVASAISPEVGVRIKGILKHAPDYAETVFWFELKQCAPTIFEILKEEELKLNFMETLGKCL